MWTRDAAAQRTIAARLGWLQAIDTMRPHAGRLRAFADAVRRAGTSDVVLLGMGGSSLAAGFPRFHVLDSVDPDAVRAAGASDPGSHFVAITDEHTPLHRRAIDEGFRDVEALLASAQSMVEACRLPDPRRNPGVALGALLAAAAAEGATSSSCACPRRSRRSGSGIEQLVAESTGKDGKGVVPITDEVPAIAGGDDRIVVEIGAGGVAGRTQRAPAMNIAYESLGAEFFRWEIATATAGFLLGVNPFDEPNVQQAKDAPRTLIEAYAATKRLPVPDADVTSRARGSR